MKPIFEYIYYRLQKFYFRWDGKNSITANIGVSMIQSMIFMDIVIIILRLFYSRLELASYSKMIANGGVLLLFGIILINHFIYRNRFDEFDKRWRDDSYKIKVFRGISVILGLCLPWVITIGLGLI